MPLVLLVEDDDILRRTYERVLSRTGYDVVTAANGAEALLRMETVVPDLVVSDLAMPQLQGVGLVRAIRHNPALADIPVVLMTGDASAQIPAGYIVLEKPFALNVLIGTIQGVLACAPAC